ncbi:MAG: nucleotidyl transferase AbiEii/AbiGii toxin family protein, partial [Dysgonamonadaceae bacterium]|nr:nucleotidyl transferase AbiEii/AbiGii toxin family protein [Dysgonamonadaceae bacterium]
AKASGKPFQLHLQLFCQEELLRRVSLSKYADNLVLKGGLLIYTLTNFESRATIDVDFLLRHLPNSVEQVKQIVDEILAANTGNDFITFETRGYEEISPQRKYQGVSFQLVGKIKNTKTPFNVDFGVGDIIVPKAEKRKIPVQLDGFAVPEISTYSLESTVAEKFDAMLQRLELTSRMKDYYDIHYLANNFDFDGRKLQEAIIETLQNRGTVYGKDSLKKIIAFADDADMQIKWRQFLKRLKLTTPKFDEVLKTIDVFIKPVWVAIIDEKELFEQWDCCKDKWIIGGNNNGN